MKISNEQSPLIAQTSLDTLPRSGTHRPSDFDSRPTQYGLGVSAHSINDIPKGRTDTIFTGSDVHPQNINELLVMLERATGLVRQHAETDAEQAASRQV